MSEAPDLQKPGKVIAAIACDLDLSPLGTHSRLLRKLGSTSVLRRTLEAVAAVELIETIVLMAPEAQWERLRQELAGLSRIEFAPLPRRPETLDNRVRAARAWNLVGWRGGAGQWTAFDEDYHPAAVAAAAKQCSADHVLCVPAHAALADSSLLNALVHHHLHKNHEMRLTYTPAAPGLCGLVLQAGIAAEMAAAQILPGQLLAYDPKAPNFDTLIRDACMQVDPALSKIQNRFLLDTDRSWALAETLLPHMPFDSAATMALAAREASHTHTGSCPRELEIELTGKRQTTPIGGVPALLREGRGELDSAHWERWLGRQTFVDDLLLTFCGDGDPLLYSDLVSVLRAARKAGVRNIHVQTDLITGAENLVEAAREGLVDVVSVQFYGDASETYAKVGGIDMYARVLTNMERLFGAVRTGLPLVVPRLLKVRETIPQLEVFFDKWLVRCGWAVIDGPTNRAGKVPFGGVVDMAPPKRRACRRLEDRMIIRSNGVAVACDQDVEDVLKMGNIESQTLAEMWNGRAFSELRALHATPDRPDVKAENLPCGTCREWYRA